MKNQLKKLQQVFIDLGLEEDISIREMQAGDIALTLNEGDGYTGFHHTFVFTKEGAFLYHGAWE